MLIITYSFPPLNNIAARRFGDISKYLEINGWEPFILTTNSVGSLKIPLPEKKIIRVGTHPQRSSEIRKKIDDKNNLKSTAIKFKREAGFNSRLIDRTYFNWYKLIKNMDLDILRKQKFDMIIASFGPGASLFAGNYLSEKLNVPWIADFRDLGALYKDNRFKKNSLFKNMDLAVERKLLKGASAITTVSNGLKEELVAYYDLPVHVIYNGWEKLSNKTNEKLKSKESPYIYYAGRFYEHRIDSLFMLIECLVSGELSLKIRSLGPKELNDKIMVFASEKGVSDKVELLAPADSETVDKESGMATINLVVEDLDKDFMWKKGNLTGKFLSLLIKQPPILAIARDDSEIGEILRETKKGELCSNEEEIRIFLNNQDPLKNNPNEKRIEFYSKERQAELLSGILNNIITNKKE